MAHNPNKNPATDPFLTTHFMPRPRINAMLDQATGGKLVYVVAGAGYEKTQTIRNYVSQQATTLVRWVQLSDNDNIPSRFWEHLAHDVSFDNPDLADKMRELGFPKTAAHFEQFAEVLRTTEHRSHRSYFVLDAFHLIHSAQVMTFVERCTKLKVPDVCVIIISRKEPGLNLTPLFSKGKFSAITEDELRYTEDEIADFLTFREVPFSKKDLSKFYSATKGWGLAVQLLSLVLSRSPGNTDIALSTMKQNVFKLFETEAFDNIPERLQKNLVKLTLVSDLPISLLSEIVDVASFIQESDQLTSFFWLDSLSGEYRAHPLYLEFLQSKLHILSHEEVQEVYKQTAQWCCENKFFMDAMRYLAKSHQYDSMVKILFSYPFRLPHDTCQYFLNILNSLEPNNEDPNVILLKSYFVPLMLVGTNKYDDAKEMTLDVISQWENSSHPFAATILRISYSNMAYIDMYTCTATHQYNAPEYISKSVEYFKQSSIPSAEVSGPFFVPHIRSYACLVGAGADFSEFDKFLEASRQAALYISETYHGMFYGYDDLVACEMAYYKNQLDAAKKYAHSAFIKARDKNQHSIEAMAKQYLLRIAIHEGDSQLTKVILKQLQAYISNSNFWNSQLLYDLYSGHFFSLIGLPEMSPSWLTMNDIDTTSQVHMPIAELTVCLNNCIALKKYDQALSVLYNSYPRNPRERYLFSELHFSLIAAVAKINIGDVAGALEDFKRAYAMSFNGVYEMFFIELGKNLHPLAVAALSQKECGIPEEWLKKIDRKASVYAKKAIVIMNAFKEDKDKKNMTQLSQRELEVLKDLYYGLSRDEIAENRYLSINTIKKILQSVYIKLNATNNVDAIRIAMEKKLVG